MNHSEISVGTFDKLAERYRDKFMELSLYDATYLSFCNALGQGRARVLDAACGPGNVSRFLIQHRPDTDLLGIDLAPRMVKLARQAVPTAQFLVHDCRHLGHLARRFDGIICAFGLPYLTSVEADDFIKASSEILDVDGILYLSFMLGRPDEAGYEFTSTGDRVFVQRHSEGHITAALKLHGFSLFQREFMRAPSAAAKGTSDLIMLARKQAPCKPQASSEAGNR